MRGNRLLAILMLLACAAACSLGRDAPPEGPPSWAIAPGAEFWRAPGNAGLLLTAPFAPGKPADASPVAPFSARFSDGGARLAAGGVEQELRTSTFTVGGRSLLATGRRDWFRAGATAQAALDASRTVVEHFQSRPEGLEWTWIVRAPVEGDIAVQARLPGLRAAGGNARELLFTGPSGVRFRVSRALVVDAAGRRWPIPLEPAPEGFSLHVAAEVARAARYPLAIDPLITPEIAVDVASPRPGDSGWPLLAWTAGVGLATWIDADLPRHQRAVRIDAAGRMLDAAPISIPKAYTGTFAVAGCGSTFMLVTTVPSGTTNALASMRIRATDGAVLDGPRELPIMSNDWMFPQLACNGTDFLLAWADGSPGVLRLMTLPADEGAPGTPIQLATNLVGFALSPLASGDFGVFFTTRSGSPAVSSLFGVHVRDRVVVESAPVPLGEFSQGGGVFAASDGTSWMLAITGVPRGSTTGSAADVLALPVGADLTPVGTLVRVADGSVGGLNGGQVVFVGDHYLFTWNQYLNPPTLDDVFAARVTRTGVVLDPYSFGLFLAPHRQNNASLAVVGNGEDLLLGYNESAPGLGAWVVALSGRGNTYTAAKPTNLNPAEDLDGAPSIAANASTALVVFESDRERLWPQETRVYAARLAVGTGAVLDDPPLRLAGGTAFQTRPVVATDGKDFLVAWVENSTNVIRAARVAADGTVGAAITLPFQGCPLSAPEVVHTKRGWVVGALCGSTTTSNVVLSMLSDDATTVLVAPVSWRRSDAMEFSLTAAEGALVVAASVRPGTTGWDVYATRVDPTTLAVRDPSGIVISAGPQDERFPKLAAIGGEVLVTWLDRRASPGRYASIGARLSVADGTLSAERVLNGSAVDQQVPGVAVAADGTDYVLAWRDAAAATKPISVQRFDGTLDSRDSAPTELAAATVAPMPAVAGAGSGRFLAAYLVDGSSGGLRTKAKGFGDGPSVAGADVSMAVQEDGTAVVSLPPFPSGDAFELVAGPVHGTLSVTGSSVSYTPAPGFVGQDGFSWRAKRWLFTTATWKAAFDVKNLHPAPTSMSSSIGTGEDGRCGAFLSATDPDGLPLEYEIVTPPAHGRLSGTGPDLTYTPEPDFNGTDRFEWRARDRYSASPVAAVDVTITPENDPPTLASASFTVREDTPAAISLVPLDVEGDPVSLSLSAAPEHGVLEGDGPDFTYRPDPDFNGDDAFFVKLFDSFGAGGPWRVAITVEPENDAPVARDLSLRGFEDGEIPFDCSASDVDGDPLDYVASAPAHGTITGALPVGTYVPAPLFHGTDAFAVTVSDGTATAVCHATVTVEHVNHPPVAVAQQLAGVEDQPLEVTLAATDPDGDALEFEVLDPPGHGTLSGVPPNLRYSPAPDANGRDSFRFLARDADEASAPVEVVIEVAPVNDAPRGGSTSETLAEDEVVPLHLLGYDVEGSPLRYALVQAPRHGVLRGALPDVEYVPDPDFNGVDSLSYVVRDESLTSDEAVITLLVVPVNDAPRPGSQAISLDEDVAAAVVLSATDPDDTVLSYSVKAPPLHGSLTGTPPALTYTPAADFHGDDAFAFEVRDPAGAVGSGTVSLTVRAVPDAPVAHDSEVTLAEDVPASFTLRADDADGDSLAFTIVRPPAAGSLQGEPPTMTYVPRPDFEGDDSLGFRVSDGTQEAWGEVRFHVTPVPDAPVARPAALITDEDQVLPIALAATDADGDALTYAIVSPPAHGTLRGAPPDLEYAPAPDFAGADAFTFTASDGVSFSAEARITIDVLAINDAPLARGGSVETVRDAAVELPFEAVDVDGDALSFAIVAAPLHGSVSLEEGKATYTPQTGFSGEDSVSYVADDGHATSAVAVIRIFVARPNEPPTVADAELETPEDTAIPLRLAAVDPEGADVSFTLLELPLHGTVTGAPPSLVYVPEHDWSGSDELVFTADDGFRVSPPARVRIRVSPVNDAPVAFGAEASTSDGAPVTIPLVASDVDSQVLAFAIARAPAHGTVVIEGARATYTPQAGAATEDSFDFVADDGLARSTPATIVVHVSPVARPVQVPPSGCSCFSTDAALPSLWAFAVLLGMRRRRLRRR